MNVIIEAIAKENCHSKLTNNLRQSTSLEALVDERRSEFSIPIWIGSIIWMNNSIPIKFSRKLESCVFWRYELKFVQWFGFVIELNCIHYGGVAIMFSDYFSLKKIPIRSMFHISEMVITSYGINNLSSETKKSV